jgi:hypothetical protein
MKHQEILTPDPECDNGYIMDEHATSCWITVGKLSVQIFRGHGRLSVAIYPVGQEMEDSIDRAIAPIVE